MAMVENLKSELRSFWAWANLSPDVYAKNGWHRAEEEEFEYPNWDDLIEKTAALLHEGEKTASDYGVILEVMAIDHEREDVLGMCEELPEQDLVPLILSGITHIQPEARWQVAELIGRTNNESFDQYLLQLLEDSNKYVERRALISLTKINPILAEPKLFSRLTDPDDYIRLVSLRMLRELNSSLLEKAVDILKNDKFEYIVEEIQEIAEGKPYVG